MLFLPCQFGDRLWLLQGDDRPVEVPGVPDDDVVVVVRGETVIEPGVDADAVNSPGEIAGGGFPTENNASVDEG